MAKFRIDGKAIREQELDRLGRRVSGAQERGHIAVAGHKIVGSDHASRIYVNNKKAACECTGISSIEHALPEERPRQLLELIDCFQCRSCRQRILPASVPKHIDGNAVLERISPAKGCRLLPPGECRQALSIGSDRCSPALRWAWSQMLEHEGIDIAGKHCVIIGRSNIVGKPMAMLMLCPQRHRDGLPFSDPRSSVADKAGRYPRRRRRQGEIRHRRHGQGRRSGARRRHEQGRNGKLCGDVDFEAVKEKAPRL